MNRSHRRAFATTRAALVQMRDRLRTRGDEADARACDEIIADVDAFVRVGRPADEDDLGPIPGLQPKGGDGGES